jgi:lysozyme family protein
MDKLAQIIEELIKVEGGYSNNPADSGGETNWGITVATARLYGYLGDMKLLPRELAVQIYINKYIKAPHFDQVLNMSYSIGRELIDTGVNMGPVVAASDLQRCLNVLNLRGAIYPDMRVDGMVGPKTLYALEKYLRRRGMLGVSVMLRCLNAIQGSRYINIAEARQKDEDFVYGWFLKRIGKDLS